mgnify:CR=1 FL=1
MELSLEEQIESMISACDIDHDGKISHEEFIFAMTGAMGYAATGAPLLAPGFALTTLGVFGTSCAANALNQIRETERDARMARTRKRPLPSGRCSPEFAATFAGVAGGAGASALAVLDPVASALAVGNMALYAGAYTSLKPKSEINTWVGAVVGGVPPLIGWAAAGGSLVVAAAVRCHRRCRRCRRCRRHRRRRCASKGRGGCAGHC